MNSNVPELPGVEPDGRFPSGPWTGFFLQPRMPGKHWMELSITFLDGIMNGEGRDRVGLFRVKGRYQVEDGRCWWTKTYLGKHSLAYQGYNEGKGIWGTWEENPGNKGGFRIWPEAMGDPTLMTMAEEVDEPISEPPPEVPMAEPVETEVAEPVGAPSERASEAISGIATRPAVDRRPQERTRAEPT